MSDNTGWADNRMMQAYEAILGVQRDNPVNRVDLGLALLAIAKADEKLKVIAA